MVEAGTYNADNVFAPNARHGMTHMRYVVDNITAHVAPGGLSLTNATTLAEVARIRSDGGVVTFATRPEAAKLAYTDDTNSSKVHVVDLSGGSLDDVSSVGALEVSFPVKHLAFSLDGTLLLTVGASAATLWKWEEGLAVQHDSVSADEVGVGVAFCPGLETPTFVVAGPTAARFIQLTEDDDASDAAAAAAGKLRMTRVSSPGASAITSLCWSRRGLWLGLTGGKLGLAKLEGTESVAEARTVSAHGCFGDETAVITQLEGCLDGGCLAAVNGGERCYWVDAEAAVVAEATLGAAARSVAMPPGASPGRKNLFLVASLGSPPCALARVPAWPAANKTNLTEDVEVVHAAGGKEGDAPGAGVVDIMRSAATLNQVPSLVEVQTLLNRVPSLKQIAKVPSLKELNARVTMNPPGTAAKAAAAAMPPPPPVAMPAAAPAGAAPCGVDADGNLAPCPGKVCANCRTQKTPLWRNGPLGPKTLCNACGVRYKLGKLPPPGGFPPGHVPPPAPLRKRPALLTTANGNPLKRQKGEKKAGAGEKKGKGAEGAGAEGAAKKKRRVAGMPSDGPLEEYVRGGKIGKSGGVLTDYDGAVLLMVLAGMYSH